MDHILHGHAVVAGTELPQENPLTYKGQLLGHHSTKSVEVTSDQNMSIVHRCPQGKHGGVVKQIGTRFCQWSHRYSASLNAAKWQTPPS